MILRQAVCALVVAGLALWAPAAPADRDAERIQLADGLFARGMFTLAASEYEALLRDDPGRDGADVLHFRLGESYRQVGRPRDAEREFRRVVVGFPESAYLHRAAFRRAGLFVDVGFLDGAVELYRAVLKREPPPEIASASWYLMGEVLLDLERDEEAAGAFRKVAEAYGESEFYPYALMKLGQVYVAMTNAPARQAEAIEFFRKVAADPPTARLGAEALFQAAEWHYRRKEYASAATRYAQLAEAYPEDTRTAETRLPAAWALHHAGRYADALAVAAATLKDDAPPQHAEWLYLKGNCERQLVRHEDAAATYGLLLDRYPDSRFAGPARYELALAFYKEGRFRDAVAVGRLLTGEATLRKDVLWLLAESYAALENYDEAVQYYRILVRDYGDSPVACDAMYRLAYHLQSRGDFTQAAAFFAGVASGWPERDLAPRALFAAGYCAARAGQDAEAVQRWNGLLERYGSDPLAEEALFQAGMAEIRLERYADALQKLRQLSQRFKDSAFSLEARYWEGMVLRELEQGADAEAALRTVLASDGVAPDLRRNAELALASVLHELGESEEAADIFQGLLEGPARDKLSPELLAWLGAYRLERGEAAGAAAVAQRLTAPSRPEEWQQTGWLLAGRSLVLRGDTDAAREALDRAVTLGPGRAAAAEAALVLADMALDAEDLEAARRYYEQAAGSPAVRDRPRLRARATMGLGRTATAAGDPGAAARYHMSVAILYDDAELVPASLRAAARAFEALGDGASATNALRELARRYPAQAEE